MASRNNKFLAQIPRGGSGSPSSELNAMSAERPFVTWTFDRHCDTMDWSPAPAASLSAVSATAVDGSVGDADLVIVGVFAPAKDDDGDKEDEKEEADPIVFNGKAKELDEMLGGALTELASDNSKAFQNGGSAGTLTPAVRVVVPGGRARRYVLLGLGPEGKEKDGVPPKVESATITKAASAVASACHDQKKVKSCNVLLPPQIVEGISSSGMLTDFSTALFSSLYVDNRYRTGKKVEIKAEDVESVKLYLEFSESSDVLPEYDAAISSGAAIARGCSLTKDIVNAPHNVLNSESLAETAKRVAEESGGSITCEILGKEECEARGMGAYLGVARGSETEPQFIHLTYKPPSGEIK
jgi:leucyl aminopeptidase